MLHIYFHLNEQKSRRKDKVGYNFGINLKLGKETVLSKTIGVTELFCAGQATLIHSLNIKQNLVAQLHCQHFDFIL